MSEEIYISKLSIIFFIGLIATAWCCVLWIKNRRWQIATFFAVFPQLHILVSRQFLSEVDAIANNDTVGYVLAVSLDNLPYENIIQNMYLYLFQIIFILILFFNLLYKKFKLDYSFMQILNSFIQYRPFFYKK